MADFSAQRCYLGGLMYQGPHTVQELVAGISETDFAIPAERRLFAAVVALSKAGTRPDPMAVTAWLRSQGEIATSLLPLVVADICSVWTDTPLTSPDAVRVYRDAVVEDSVRRLIAESVPPLTEVSERSTRRDLKRAVTDACRAMVHALQRLPLGPGEGA